MTAENIQILVILGVTVGLFLWGRIRYDIVALIALLACIIMGLVPQGEAFLGFGNPAVITVAAVLILSKGLESSGAVDLLASRVLPKNASPIVSILALLVLGAFLSAFMNNVGAMAMLMPLALQIAKRSEISPGRVLMPLAFATILGGMTTLIGTPPNLIVSGYRTDALGDGYSMFNFFPVGGAVAVIGILFVVFAARKLVPERKPANTDDFDVGLYESEIKPMPKSAALKMSVADLQAKYKDANLEVNQILRNGEKLPEPIDDVKFELGDVILFRADIRLVHEGINRLGFEVVSEDYDQNLVQTPDMILRELVILPDSPLKNHTPREASIRDTYALNLLAISGKNEVSGKRLNDCDMHAGDVLLVQGAPDAIANFATRSLCVPLAERELDIPNMNDPLIAGGLMIFSILIAAFGLLSTASAFVLGAVLMVITRIVSARRIYDAVDWPIIVLLGALLPVASAMQSTGTADLIANFLLNTLANGHAVVALTIILVVTMFLSDVMNNAATAAVMCPIALQTSTALGVEADSFLMAVAIGASCAFLTPIGHQNNTLILRPGGFKFGDYWKLGLPLEIVIVIVAIPLLLVFWPL